MALDKAVRDLAADWAGCMANWVDCFARKIVDIENVNLWSY